MIKNKILIKRSNEKDPDINEYVAAYKDKTSGEIYFETEFLAFYKDRTVRKNPFKGSDHIIIKSNDPVTSPHWKKLKKRYLD